MDKPMREPPAVLDLERVVQENVELRDRVAQLEARIAQLESAINGALELGQDILLGTFVDRGA